MCWFLTRLSVFNDDADDDDGTEKRQIAKNQPWKLREMFYCGMEMTVIKHLIWLFSIQFFLVFGAFFSRWFFLQPHTQSRAWNKNIRYVLLIIRHVLEIKSHFTHILDKWHETLCVCELAAIKMLWICIILECATSNRPKLKHMRNGDYAAPLTGCTEWQIKEGKKEVDKSLWIFHFRLRKTGQLVLFLGLEFLVRKLKRFSQSKNRR